MLAVTPQGQSNHLHLPSTFNSNAKRMTKRVNYLEKQGFQARHVLQHRAMRGTIQFLKKGRCVWLRHGL